MKTEALQVKRAGQKVRKAGQKVTEAVLKVRKAGPKVTRALQKVLHDAKREPFDSHATATSRFLHLRDGGSPQFSDTNYFCNPLAWFHHCGKCADHIRESHRRW